MTNTERAAAYPGTFTLQLRARHFKNTRFCSNGKCAIAKATKEIFPNHDVSEGVDNTLIEDARYLHSRYGEGQFDFDMAAATSHNFDDTVIREIVMNKAK